MSIIYIKIAAGLALALAIFGAGHHFGAAGVQKDWDADKLATVSRVNDAIRARLDQNEALANKQTATNATITKVKNEELAPVRERIITRRVYVGPALCSGPATPSEAESTGGSDSADPGSRVVREDIERDLRALKLEVEKHLATGRACQAFIRENGLVP